MIGADDDSPNMPEAADGEGSSPSADVSTELRQLRAKLEWNRNKVKEQQRLLEAYQVLEQAHRELHTNQSALERKLKWNRAKVESLKREIQQLAFEESAPRKQQGNRRNPAHQSVLVERLVRGIPFAEAALEQARTLIANDHRTQAQAFAASLLRTPATAPAGNLIRFSILRKEGFFDSCAQVLEDEECRDLVRRYLTAGYVETFIVHDLDRGVAELADLLPLSAEIAIPHAAEWLSLVALLVAKDRIDAARSLHASVAACVEETGVAVPAEVGHEIAWQRQSFTLLEQAHEVAPLEPAQAIAYGVMDYRSFARARTSSNIGDYVQVLAALGNLLRLRNVRVVAEDPSLDHELKMVRERIAPHPETEDVTGVARIIPISRDFARAAALPGPTWLIANGWYMHPLESEHYDFPWPDNVRPIFISVHINRPALVTDEAIAYLRRYAPIGCRDWSTVYLLRQCGIPAFFSGCLTTTIDTFFPHGSVAGERIAATLYVDRQPDEDHPETSVRRHEETVVRDRSMAENLADAIARLDDYARYDRIVTSRLHCYLPVRSIGVPVEFLPKRRTDERFEGLMEIDQARFEAMRDALRAKLDAIHRVIFSGASEEEVYRAWREICADDVRAADAYCDDVADLPVAAFDPAPICQRIADARAAMGIVNPARSANDAIDVAFACDTRLLPHLDPALESVIVNTSRPVVVHLLTRGVEPAQFETLRQRFPETQINVYPCDTVDHADGTRLLKHTTISTMDRLLLPHLLADRPRVIYLDVDLICLGDLADLWRLPLDGRLLAGRPIRRHSWAAFHSVVRRICQQLDEHRAIELRRRTSQTAAFGATCFNAGVLVMNLEQMRASASAETALAMVDRYGVNDQDVLNLVAAGNYLPLPGRWNHWPWQDEVDDLRIIHWVGPEKPWSATYSLHQEAWTHFRKAVDLRHAASKAADRNEACQ